MEFSIDDIKKLKAMNGIVKKGAFQITGEAVIAAASLFHWLDTLEPKIMKAIEDGEIRARQNLLPPSPVNIAKAVRRGRK